MNVTVRDTLKIAPSGIEVDSNRTTIKSINQMIPRIYNQVDISSELFNQNRSNEYKLALIEEYLIKDKESSIGRLCILYKYCYKYDKEILS